MEEEEYELVPLSPIRRLEKRMETVEKRGMSQDTVREVLDIIKTNQEIVEDIVKVNSEMISRVSDLSNSVNMLMGKVNDFISRIEVASNETEEEKKETTAEETGRAGDAEKRFDDRLAKIEKRVNAMILSSVAKQRLARHA